MLAGLDANPVAAFVRIQLEMIEVRKTVIFPKKARKAVASFVHREDLQQVLKQEASRQAMDRATETVRILAEKRRAERAIRSEAISQSVAV